VGGRVQIYEINTNPKLPSPTKGDKRDERRQIIRNGFLASLKATDCPLDEAGVVRFHEPRPRAHNLHLPRWRIVNVALRRARRLVGGLNQRKVH
jgi:hypothetical protein